MNDILLLAALVGATLIVVRGTLLRRVRAVWPSLLGCSQCVGFWIGAAAGWFSLVSCCRGRWFDTVLVGCAVSLLAMAMDIVLLKLAEGPEDQRR